MSNKKRLILSLQGMVQGVGFRPFVYRLALQHNLVGCISNTHAGVKIDAQGEISKLQDFQRDLSEKKPKRAWISQIHIQESPLGEAKNFVISSSEETASKELPLIPDTAICSECLQEFYDPKNRRYLYPFIHCMACGPRFSLLERMPFDRANTAMSDFPMCESCLDEYHNPRDRRFYSQTNCCPLCGPKLQLLDSKKNLISEEIEPAIDYLHQGKILALKNTGGFLLLADATNEDAVNRLRKLKKRPKKPFALFVLSLLEAEKIADVDPSAKKVLTSSAAPIVLLKKKASLSPSVSFDSPYHAVMLAHNALHHLLLSQLKRPLIATSGNISGKPVCITENEAFQQLSQVADYFLLHNRRIVHRLDDSIVQIIDKRPMLIRKARGYIPDSIEISKQTQCLLGVGGHQKNSFAIAKDQRIYFSQHIGDLDSEDSSSAFDREVKSFETLFHSTPDIGIGDLHPDYYTSRYLQEKKFPSFFIQHHRAHVYSGMLDNQISPPFFSIAWDGTGWGDNQMIWGGEAFIVTEKGMDHFATLSPFRLPGSEKAVREPRRSLLGVLHALFGSRAPSLQAFSKEELSILCTMLEKKIHSPLCSSMGRLFDAMSSLLDCCDISSFEGEAALALETLANKAKGDSLPLSLSLKRQNKIWLLEWQDMIKKILIYKTQGVRLEELALSFHLALADGIVSLSQKAGFNKVLLTGGCMQNQLLAEKAISKLREEGFTPFWHHQIPPNDGGLAAGQIFGMIFEENNRPLV